MRYHSHKSILSIEENIPVKENRINGSTRPSVTLASENF